MYLQYVYTLAASHTSSIIVVFQRKESRTVQRASHSHVVYVKVGARALTALVPGLAAATRVALGAAAVLR